MGYIERIPSTVNELYENLTKLYENRSHIKNVAMNTSTSHLEVTLDWSAHKFGGGAGQDFYLPIKPAKQNEALKLAQKVWHGDVPPSVAEAQQLFDMIDPQRK